jgi:hypothetical protein
MQSKIEIAAKACGLSCEEFAKKVLGLLSPSKCRNTEAALFTPAVRHALISSRGVATLKG